MNKSLGFEFGLKRLILVGDIGSRSWPNIGDSFCTFRIKVAFFATLPMCNILNGLV